MARTFRKMPGNRTLKLLRQNKPKGRRCHGNWTKRWEGQF